MSAFRVGQKVVCINARWFEGESPLVSRAVYTVSALGHASGRTVTFGIVENWPAIGLVEVDNPLSILWDCFNGFDVQRFRPLAYKPQSLEHDVAQFRKISRQLPAPAKESA